MTLKLLYPLKNPSTVLPIQILYRYTFSSHNIRELHKVAHPRILLVLISENFVLQKFLAVQH